MFVVLCIVWSLFLQVYGDNKLEYYHKARDFHTSCLTQLEIASYEDVRKMLATFPNGMRQKPNSKEPMKDFAFSGAECYPACVLEKTGVLDGDGFPTEGLLDIVSSESKSVKLFEKFTKGYTQYELCWKRARVLKDKCDRANYYLFCGSDNFIGKQYLLNTIVQVYTDLGNKTRR